jgi:hypothetical protein
MSILKYWLTHNHNGNDKFNDTFQTVQRDDEIDFHNIDDISQTLQVNEIEVTKINDMSQTLQMDEIDNVEWFTIRVKH